MSDKHLTPKQWDTVDARSPDRDTRDHLATCDECRAVVAESRALLVAMRRPGRIQGPEHQLATAHPVPEDLAAYGDGALFGTVARSIEEHLEHCSDCRDDIVAMRDVAAAGDLNETVSVDVRDQLLERLSRAGRPERVTSLGEWLVKANRTLGVVFSPLAPADIASPGVALASQARLERLPARRSNLEDRLSAAVHEVERARSMMEQATERMREASLQVEQILRDVAGEHDAQVAALAAALREAIEAPRMNPDAGGTLLKLTAADVRLRIESTDRDRPDVFTVTVITQDDQPAPGVSLEARSPDGEPTLRTTDENGQASFSLERGESTLRLVRHGVWELQLARLS